LEFLKEAVELAEQNPGIEIYVASSNENCFEDGGWTQHRITKVEKTSYFLHYERVILNAEDVVDAFDGEITEEEAEAKMKGVILIYTEAF
jgi:hypothetical protein